MNNFLNGKKFTAILILLLVLLATFCSPTKTKAEETNENNYYVVVLEENKEYTILSLSVVFMDLDGLERLIQRHVGGQATVANQIFIEMIESGDCFQVPHMNYDVIYVKLGNGYTVYKLK